jgi:hypothetical protein
MEVKPLFLSCCNFKVGMGTKTRFWEDIWITDTCLASHFPRLYAISNDHNITVQKACPSTLNSRSFRRTLVGERLAEWNKLLEKCRKITLNNEEDRLVWLLSSYF